MATVTHSFILEMDTNTPNWPEGNISAARASGVIVSETETVITNSDSDYVDGKYRTRIVRVFRSLEDKENFEAEALASTARQAFVTTYHITRINEVIS